jgi:hypothetical protein
MKKRIVSQAEQKPNQLAEEGWLDLQRLADVEITSEDSEYPIESALLATDGSGWRAAQVGEQTIRLLFISPQRIERIWLKFVEPDFERTQQFVLRWSAEGENSLREIVRQQWNFSPQGATTEIEDYAVDLSNVSVLELRIVPDVSGGDARATLARMRIG